MGDVPACEHDYVLVSCVGDGEGTATVCARCTRCEELVEARGCRLTGVDYGTPVCIAEKVVLVEIEGPPDRTNDDFYDWLRTVMVPEGGWS